MNHYRYLPLYVLAVFGWVLVLAALLGGSSSSAVPPPTLANLLGGLRLMVADLRLLLGDYPVLVDLVQTGGLFLVALPVALVAAALGRRFGFWLQAIRRFW